jgi:hypothetical protein
MFKIIYAKVIQPYIYKIKENDNVKNKRQPYHYKYSLLTNKTTRVVLFYDAIFPSDYLQINQYSNIDYTYYKV